MWVNGANCPQNSVAVKVNQQTGESGTDSEASLVFTFQLVIYLFRAQTHSYPPCG